MVAGDHTVPEAFVAAKRTRYVVFVTRPLMGAMICPSDGTPSGRLFAHAPAVVPPSVAPQYAVTLVLLVPVEVSSPTSVALVSVMATGVSVEISGVAAGGGGAPVVMVIGVGR